MTFATPATETRPVPWVGVAALVVATASGMLFFLLGGAPPAYIALNGLALLLGLVLVVAFPAGRMNERAAICAVVLGVTGIAATLVSGFDLEGIRRWLPLGPVRLHAAMLFLPAIAVLMPYLSGRIQLAAVIALATVFAVQPDFAAALALAAGFILSRPGRQERLVTGIGVAASMTAIATTLFRPDPLVAVKFVERVVPDAFAANAMLALLIGAALLFACAAPLFARSGNPRAVRALAGVIGGFMLASVIGAYPVPLGGYGASPILGYALALALLRMPVVPSRAE
ncbi:MULTISPECIES: hypothetical protein [unclassified Sphingopyxis]|uniref:hypothetical protein n=1 Tax=unclassified Sphingopyxis TaxID=2614943 RepID=UPI0007369858|nr:MULTISPECIES: hypothetical protein [unclassified Sphingopyxis]KTE37915.1 hypothetical protein ATE62_12360 [Sphingopyxis sp. HIX]KTE83454.1 hypothetical protein ATE72_13885 [Sphingopyxis sp. HXXIV]